MEGKTRKCPYCAEEIAAEAVRCPYCRSRVAALDPARWYRDHPGRRLAGVAAAIGHAVALPVSGVRLGFIVLTFVHLIGPLLYGALWLIVPFTPQGPSLLERGLARAQDWVARLRGRDRPPSAANGADRSDLDAGAVPGGPLA